MMWRPTAFVPVLIVVAAASGCGVFSGEDVAETTVPVISATTTAATPVSTTDPVRDLERAEALFSVLDTGDSAALTSASSMVTPGSPAAVLVAHQATVAELVAEVADVVSTTSTSAVVTPDDAPATTSTVSVAVDVVYTDPVFDDDGLVRSFAVNGVSIDSLVREAGPVAVVEGVQGRVASVYRTASGRVSALIDVTADAESLTVFGFAAVHRARTIDDGSSGLTEAIGSWGVDSLTSGESTRILVLFDDGELDGEILVTVLTQSGVDLDLVLPLIAP